jgi:hypothetical protein
MGRLTDKEVRIHPDAWRRNGGKMMRTIHHAIGEDRYRLRFPRFVDDGVVIVFSSAEDAVLFRLVTDGAWHAAR